MPAMIRSNLPVSNAGISPDHSVGTNSTLTPRSSATLVATSISNPRSTPSLSLKDQGTKMLKPTRMTPRLVMPVTRSSLAAASLAPPQEASAPSAVKTTARITSHLKVLPIFRILYSFLYLPSVT